MAGGSFYSLWAMPEAGSPLAARVAALIADLSSQHGTPPFEPHVTVLGAFGDQLDEAEVGLLPLCITGGCALMLLLSMLDNAVFDPSCLLDLCCLLAPLRPPLAPMALPFCALCWLLQVVARTRALAAQVAPYRCRVADLASGSTYFQSVYLRMHKDPPVRCSEELLTHC